MKNAIPVLAVALLSVSCAHWPREKADGTSIEAEIAARQGKEVDRICFARQINGWRAIGEHAVLLEKGVNDWYKLDLVGTCRPEWAFNAIAVRTRPAGSLCLSKGDRIETFTTPMVESCAIVAIYEWDEKAEVPPAQ